MHDQPPQLNIAQSELAPVVADYFDNLLAQRDAILERYGLAPETAETFCNLRSTDEDRAIILALYENIVYVLEHKQIPPHVKQEKYRSAREIMGEEFIGIEAIETAFNIHLDPENIPEIPFSCEELTRAHDLNQFLILRLDRISDDKKLTMENMQAMLADAFQKEGLDTILYDVVTYQHEDFFTRETPVFHWALVSKEVIPDSISNDYLKQTEIMIDYVENHVFKGMTLPTAYQDAMREFEEKKSAIRDMMSTDWWEAAEMLEELSINTLTRQTPVECLYDLLLYLKNNEKRLMEYVYTGTCRRDYDGRFVFVGCIDSHGVRIRRFAPKTSVGFLGMSFSRHG